MTLRRQSKVPYSRKGWGTLFASGMKQTGIATGSPVAFAVIGARCASVTLASGLAWRVPCGRPQHGFTTHHGPTPIATTRTVGRSIPHGLGLRLPVVATALFTHALRHACPTGRDVGARHGSPTQWAPEALATRQSTPRPFTTPARRASVA